MPIEHERVATTIGFLPEAERTTAYYLFSRAERYECKIRLMDTRSIDHIRFFGTPTSGDEDYDREMRNEVVTRMFTIAEMACYFRDGVPVWVRHKSDTKKIYERITEHLIAWRDALQGLNHPKAPIEDLLVLDEFAHKVYEHAKWHFKDPYTVSLVQRAMNARFSSGSLLGTPMAIPTAESPPPSRDSFTELFVNHRPAETSPKFGLNGQSASPFADPTSPNSLPGGYDGDTNSAMNFATRFGHR
jgi:hypothetical protein